MVARVAPEINDTFPGTVVPSPKLDIKKSGTPSDVTSPADIAATPRRSDVALLTPRLWKVDFNDKRMISLVDLD